jgi:hypothetical protein
VCMREVMEYNGFVDIFTLKETWSIHHVKHIEHIYPYWGIFDNKFKNGWYTPGLKHSDTLDRGLEPTMFK